MVVAAQSAGFDINSARNGIALPTSPAEAAQYRLPRHWGYHPNYTRQLKNILDLADRTLEQRYGPWAVAIPATAAIAAVEAVADYVRADIIAESAAAVGTVVGINEILTPMVIVAV